MDVARSAPQGTHYYHADVINLLPYLGIKKGARALWCSKLIQHTLAFYIKYVPPTVLMDAVWSIPRHHAGGIILLP